MNRTLTYSLCAVSAISMTAAASRSAISAGQGTALVRLQASSPGVAQTGHLNITGNGVFGGNVGIATSPTTAFNLDVRRNGWVPPAFNYRGAIRGSTGTGALTDCGVLGVTDVGNGVAGTAHQPEGWGVLGSSYATTGSGVGGYFFSASSAGQGVVGLVNATTGLTRGVYGESASIEGIGVYGEATAITGQNYGGKFVNKSGTGSGVFGKSTNGPGVYGQSEYDSGGYFVGDTGVFGYGFTTGVVGLSYAENGYGIFGSASGSASVSVLGSQSNASGWAGFFQGGLGTYTTRLSVNTTDSTYPIQMRSTFGDKISLYGASSAHFGFGVKDSLLQIHSDNSGSDIAFGFGSSASFTETMRVMGSGLVGIGTSAPESKLDVDGRITANTLAVQSGAAANTVLLGSDTGLASWGTVGSARLTSDAASLSKVTNGNFYISSGDLNGGDLSRIVLSSDSTDKITLSPNGTAGALVVLSGPNGNTNVRLSNFGGYSNNGLIGVNDSAGSAQAQMYVDPSGNGNVVGDTKSFLVPDPTDPRFNIMYACVEGPEAAMYTRGTGQLVNGRAVIDLPDHFLKLANMQTLTIQVTPLDECEGLFCKKLNGEIVVKELRKGQSNIEFDWEVKAVRKGHEDWAPVRPWDDALPEGDKKEMWNARLKSLEMKKNRGASRP